MKHFRLFFSALLMSSLLWGCVVSMPPQELKAMTFNVRMDTPSDSLNSWVYRREHIISAIKYYHPDFIGTQEVLHHQLTYLDDQLEDYSYIGVGRADGKQAGEYSAIIYDSEKFDVEFSGTFALSETPDKIGSMGWDAACERIVTYAVLHDWMTGRDFAVFNTHFDHVGDIARAESAKLIIDRIQHTVGHIPIVILGDFNLIANSIPLKTIVKGGYNDVRKISPIKYGPKWTFHDFGRLDVEKREIIDHIFVNEGFEVLDYRVIADVTPYGYLSDHCPVMATLEID